LANDKKENNNCKRKNKDTNLARGRIVKYREQVEGQKKIPPPSVEVADEKEYEVEEILDRQEKRGKTKYLVK